MSIHPGTLLLLILLLLLLYASEILVCKSSLSFNIRCLTLFLTIDYSYTIGLILVNKRGRRYSKYIYILY
ncbi:uncharacterized protein BX663DRAFT_501310 [Cokeromyces recurvatus]|uniref:uncharacterized protein n=1 Tax=Cokeromyces recurvatus TaxID=90255 RepID=UPI002220A0AC|nr:uncharacterized protein BX663DRAFT_501310 [Cokeromyces recurvatus]KAI7905000.1 hypothetical protein BX663DRAFT_501310 [Cokeromyces recurvatus]